MTASGQRATRAGPWKCSGNSKAEFSDGAFFGVSGELGDVSEVAAPEATLGYVAGGFDAVAVNDSETPTISWPRAGRVP
jgi:hypothetical protein